MHAIKVRSQNKRYEAKRLRKMFSQDNEHTLWLFVKIDPYAAVFLIDYNIKSLR